MKSRQQGDKKNPHAPLEDMKASKNRTTKTLK